MQSTLDKIIKKIKSSPNIALFHHINPDCDSISSSYGLLLALKSKFPNKKIVVCGNVEYLKEHFPFLKLNYDHFVSSVDASFLGIIGDTSSIKRIDLREEFEKCETKICFDHHKSNIDFAADLFWWEPSWIASTMQAINIATKLNVKFDNQIAFYLAIGLLTDSNNFAFSLADQYPVELYAKLLNYISDEQMNNFYNSMWAKEKEDIEVMSYLINKIEYSNSASYVLVDAKFVKKYSKERIKSKIHSIGNIVNFPIWAMFIERVDNVDEFKWEVHLRSNGPEVNKVAMNFNGGGHTRACGAKIKSKNEIKDVLKQLDSLVV